uniref:Uncharacterized protein n=1 Tax=Chromera velia CCMP2878 TaxID=1169474 RepID=A0A0G4G3S5_9ALVE|eukprot:Cvel_4145.t1-p1 / transcript=Cvel_4145.t1 / gene=Cvel_4145 / organism=Chromera_velia_CCMP2878 / gene_product=hypothetical protein / transcript_product=hypothetical protein / location=Cvel_scaffold178:827-3494(-) / protein_length=419 / sequence_SO=supercontig / SO=protein_coding / is_pseudo=false
MESGRVAQHEQPDGEDGDEDQFANFYKIKNPHPSKSTSNKRAVHEKHVDVLRLPLGWVAEPHIVVSMTGKLGRAMGVRDCTANEIEKLKKQQEGAEKRADVMREKMASEQEAVDTTMAEARQAVTAKMDRKMSDISLDSDAAREHLTLFNKYGTDDPEEISKKITARQQKADAKVKAISDKIRDLEDMAPKWCVWETKRIDGDAELERQTLADLVGAEAEDANLAERNKEEGKAVKRKKPPPKKGGKKGEGGSDSDESDSDSDVSFRVESDEEDEDEDEEDEEEEEEGGKKKKKKKNDGEAGGGDGGSDDEDGSDEEDEDGEGKEGKKKKKKGKEDQFHGVPLRPKPRLFVAKLLEPPPPLNKVSASAEEMEEIFPAFLSECNRVRMNVGRALDRQQRSTIDGAALPPAGVFKAVQKST